MSARSVAEAELARIVARRQILRPDDAEAAVGLGHHGAQRARATSARGTSPSKNTHARVQGPDPGPERPHRSGKFLIGMSGTPTGSDVGGKRNRPAPDELLSVVREKTRPSQLRIDRLGRSLQQASADKSTAVRASWASSCAMPIAWVTRAMAAMSRVDLIFHTASIAGCTSFMAC